jgi:hypothetical protein
VVLSFHPELTELTRNECRFHCIVNSEKTISERDQSPPVEARKERTMRRIPQAIYMTPDELDQRILELTVEAHHLEDSEERQTVLKEIAQLRIYADAALD